MSTPSYDPQDRQPTADPAAQGYGPGYQVPPGSTAGTGQPLSGTVLMRPDQQRLWATLAHLSPIAAGLLLTPVSGGFLYAGMLGPLVVFLVLKNRGGFVRTQALEALNFQIIPTIVWLAGALLAAVTFGIGLIVVVPVLAVVGIIALVFQIIAAVRANQGVEYRYPFSWRLVK